jgi:hypothetical protein
LDQNVENLYLAEKQTAAIDWSRFSPLL